MGLREGISFGAVSASVVVELQKITHNQNAGAALVTIIEKSNIYRFAQSLVGHARVSL